MEELTPNDLTADELYRILTENPNQMEFTQEDMEKYKQ